MNGWMDGWMDRRVHSLCVVYGCFCAKMAELNSCSSSYSLQSLKYLLSCPLQKKFDDL